MSNLFDETINGIYKERIGRDPLTFTEDAI